MSERNKRKSKYINSELAESATTLQNVAEVFFLRSHGIGLDRHFSLQFRVGFR